MTKMEIICEILSLIQNYKNNSEYDKYEGTEFGVEDWKNICLMLNTYIKG